MMQSNMRHMFYFYDCAFLSGFEIFLKINQDIIIFTLMMLNIKIKRSIMKLNKPVFHRNKTAKNIVKRKKTKLFTMNRSSFMFLFNLKKKHVLKLFLSCYFPYFLWRNFNLKKTMKNIFEYF